MLPGFIRRTLPFFFLPLAALAQAGFPLAGAVTNASTGQPLPRARVIALRTSGDAETREVTFTDAAGAFRFPSLPAGRYSLLAHKPRFSPNQFSPPPAIDLSAPREQVSLSLVPFSVIAGQVADADGQPLRLVRIEAYRQVVVLGHHRLIRAGAAFTDDRGSFRIWDLPAGRYFVRAMSRAGGTFSLADESAPSTVGRRAFAPVYAGGFERLTEATPTDLTPGQQARVDFRLPHLPAYRVRGTVTGFLPAVPVRFELRRLDTEPTEPRTFFNPATGNFTVFDLLPGSYQLRIRQGERSTVSTAEALVKVGPGENSPVLLSVRPPATLTLRIEGPGTLPCNSVLIDGDHPTQPVAYLEPDKPTRVPAGDYHVSVFCSDSVPESIRYGSAELLVSERLTIPVDAPPGDLIITRSRRSGKLLIALEGESADMPVLLLPGNAAMGAPLLLEGVVISGRASKLLPGPYTVYSLRDRLAPYREPAFLGQLTKGISVQIEDGQSTQVVVEKLTQP